MLEFFKVATATVLVIAATTAILGMGFYELVKREKRNHVEPPHNRRRADHEAADSKERELTAKV